MKPTKQTRRNFYLPDDLWRDMKRAAAAASREQGRKVSVAEWVREAVAQKLRRART